MCSSPKLIAACHVLHRLLMPRHSPCALFSLTCFWFSLLRIMQTIFRSFRNCLFYPFGKDSTFFLVSSSKCFHLSVALLFAFVLCSVFKVQIPLSVESRYKPLSLIACIRSQEKLVGPSGLEPPTLRLSVVRSSQLSYGPISTSWWR